MALSQLYGPYFQKSKTFLFPILGLKKTDYTKNLGSFIQIENKYTTSDYKLIVTKNQKPDTEEYRKFEKYFINTHVLFEDMFIENDLIVYVFNLESYKEDWNYFLKGQYSKINQKTKDKIKNYYGDLTNEWQYVKSYLYPEDYYEDYSRLLNVDIKLLRDVGELCDIYDNKAETLILSNYFINKPVNELF